MRPKVARETAVESLLLQVGATRDRRVYGISGLNPTWCATKKGRLLREDVSDVDYIYIIFQIFFVKDCFIVETCQP